MIDKNLLGQIKTVNDIIKNPQIYNDLVSAQRHFSVLKEQKDILDRTMPQLQKTISAVNFSAVENLKRNIATIKAMKNISAVQNMINNSESKNDFNAKISTSPSIKINEELNKELPILNLTNKESDNISKAEFQELFNTLIESMNSVAEAIIEGNNSSKEHELILKNLLETSNKQFQSSEKESQDSKKFNNKLFYLSLATLIATISIPLIIAILTSKGYL